MMIGSNHFNSKLAIFWNLVRRFHQISKEQGLIYALRCLLSYLGVESYVNVGYQNLDVKVEVRHMPFWRELVETWEPNCFSFLLDIVREGDIIFDVGAWIGPYSLFFSKVVGPRGKVVAFEPSSKSLNILVEHLRRNKTLNVFPEPCGLGSSEELVEYRGFARDISMVGFKKGHRSSLPIFYAKCTTIDKYCEEHRIIPDGLKIDVEGAEGLVIEGAEKILKTYSPWALIEFHDSLLNEKESNDNWKKITKYAKELIFIQGSKSKYQYGDEITSKPNGDFHVFIRFGERPRNLNPSRPRK